MAGPHRDRAGELQALRVGLAVTALLCLAELIGGWLTNSLALISDAAHMFTDVGALALAVFAVRFAARPASQQKTFGYHRAEILAALVNGVVLWVVVFFILWEAWQRFLEPETVRARGMLVVAVFGLVANVVVALRLRAHRDESLNLRGAYLHVVSDLLGSIGAVAAGVVLVTTGWAGADAVASVGIAILILAGSWRLVREAVDVLMEAVPPHVDLERLERALASVPGTCEIHDLHVWSITTGHCALSVHAVVDGSASDDEILDAMEALCARDFLIDHATIQLERASRRATERGH